MIGVTSENENVCDGADGVPPEAIQTDELEGSMLSDITVEEQPRPLTSCTVLTPSECGMPETPPRRLLVMPSEEALETGYDSDGNLGPFMSDSVRNEEFVSMDEVAPEAPTVITPLPGNEGESAAAATVPLLDDETIAKMKVSELRTALEVRGLPKNGLKTVLVDRLKGAVAEGVPLVADRPAVEVENTAGPDFHPSAYWKEMSPDGDDIDESIMNVDGIQFRAPTTSAEEHNAQNPNRPKKRNYAEIFDRSPFTSPTRLLPEKNDKGNYKRDCNNNYKYKHQATSDTVPNFEYLFENGVGFDSHPVQWFDLFFPSKRKKDTHPKAVTMDDMTAWLNVKALIANAGRRGGKYSKFVDFTKEEFMSHLSLYLLHAISPSPQINFKFKSEIEDPVNGSTLCHEVFGNGGVTRHKEFKAFFSATDPIVPTPPTSSHPNWKIDPCLKHFVRVSKNCMFIGTSIAIDEQDIGFQGKHKDKQRVTFKKVGDGFLLDALCSDGYTYTFYFRNQPAPKSWIDKGLSPLHARVMSLVQQLPNETRNYVCGMDNLYISPKFAKFMLNESGKRVMIHGVCRPSRGIPKCIIQNTVTKKDDILKEKGTVKCAILVGDSKCKDLVSMSFYDSKPVYFVTNACKSVKWVEKKRKLWHKERGKKVMVPFFRLNIVDEYNNGMGDVDQADQLRLQYRIHYWLRNQKWWFAIFLWIFECSHTNCYVLYRKFYETHGRKPPRTHYEFIQDIALAWLKPSQYWPKPDKVKHRSSQSSTCDSTVTASIITRRVSGSKKRSAVITDNSLNPYSGSLRCRLDRSLNHLPTQTKKPEASCQMYYWVKNGKYRKHLMKCPTCNVILSLEYYKMFHEVSDLSYLKE